MDFLLVYIAEAHADDEWPIGSDLVFNQPKTIQDRNQIVGKFLSETDFKWPTVMDNENNQFDEIYAAWPLRFYIIKNNRLTYIAAPENGGYYNIPEILENIELNIQ